jgi:hypothetical protein
VGERRSVNTTPKYERDTSERAQLSLKATTLPPKLVSFVTLRLPGGVEPPAGEAAIVDRQLIGWNGATSEESEQVVEGAVIAMLIIR